MIKNLLLAMLMVTVLTACPPIKIDYPNAEQPQLVDVVLHVNRVCGAFDLTRGQINFACPALPTSEPSGWQLTPLDLSDVPPFRTTFAFNSAVGIRVRTPSFTTIEVAFKRTANAPASSRQVLQQLMPPSAPGRTAPSLESQHAVWVESVDNGTTKTWTITTRVSTCREENLLEITNISPKGRSDPLLVSILRSPQETSCESYGFGGFYSSGHTSSSGGNTTPVAPSCTRSTFMFCEHCAGMAVLRSYEACSERQAEIDLGYRDTNGQAIHIGAICNVVQISDPAQCK